MMATVQVQVEGDVEIAECFCQCGCELEIDNAELNKQDEVKVVVARHTCGTMEVGDLADRVTELTATEAIELANRAFSKTVKVKLLGQWLQDAVLAVAGWTQ
jgi:hypothetical protein